MSNEIPIKIKTESQISQQDIKKALNLNRVPMENAKNNKQKTRRFWPILSLIFLLIALGLSAKLFFFNHQAFSGYQKIIPEDAKVAILLKLSQIESLGPTLAPELEQNSQLYRWLKDKIDQFLKDSGVSLQQDLVPIFNEDALFLMLPSASNNQANWAIVAQLKNTQDQQDKRVLTKIESGLRRDFSLNQIIYRQTTINSVYSFNQINQPYYYAQVNNFIIVGNNLVSFQQMVDRIIGN